MKHYVSSYGGYKRSKRSPINLSDGPILSMYTQKNILEFSGTYSQIHAYRMVAWIIQWTLKICRSPIRAQIWGHICASESSPQIFNWRSGGLFWIKTGQQSTTLASVGPRKARRSFWKLLPVFSCNNRFASKWISGLAWPRRGPWRLQVNSCVQEASGVDTSIRRIPCLLGRGLKEIWWGNEGPLYISSKRCMPTLNSHLFGGKVPFLKKTLDPFLSGAGSTGGSFCHELPLKPLSQPAMRRGFATQLKLNTLWII